MHPAWIAERLTLNGLALRLDQDVETGEAAVVVARESLAVIREASELVRAARRRCASRLRQARQRETRWRAQKREALNRQALDQIEALRRETLTDVARIASALTGERAALQAGIETLMTTIAHAAARRLLIELPGDLAARSSARLLLDEWRASRGEGDGRLRAHPDDAAVLGGFAADTGWTLTPDSTLETGHCVLEHPMGSLHASYRDNVGALIDVVATDATASETASPPTSAANSLPPPHISQEPPDDLDLNDPPPDADRAIADEEAVGGDEDPQCGGHRPRGGDAVATSGQVGLDEADDAASLADATQDP
ncbi:hypothetical protein ACNI65_17470 [Roseateles sp. So40a]|uniref:FliH/SctL family protein n=1 Tax=Roseateles sp. So40a TaxID=3400226 RepID=UPI003A89705C